VPRPRREACRCSSWAFVTLSHFVLGLPRIWLRSLGATASAALLLAAAPAVEAGTVPVAPGGNVSAAYNQAQPGDVIALACGSYGDWDTPNGGSKQVTVKAATRNCAKFSRLHAKSSNITFDGLDVDAGGGVPECSGGDCAAYETWGGNTNITFRNGRIGHVGGQKGAFLHGVESTAPQGIVIENTEIHDVRVTASGQHLECVMSHSPGVTFRGNTFRNCGVFDISLGRGDWWGQPEYGNVTMVNNLFGHSVDDGTDWHYYGLAWWLTSLDGARIVNNTFESPVIMDRANGGAGGVWANNIGGGWTCEPGVVYVGNVGKSCSAQDKAVNPSSSYQNQTAPMGWVNPGAFDFHLTPGSRAVDAGSAEYAPARDREGTPRSGLPDAGAYEYDSGRRPALQPPPAKGKRPRVRVLRVSPAVICRRARRGCPSRARLKLVLSQKARVIVRVSRVRRTHAAAKRGRTLRRPAMRRGTIGIRARGLARGRYRIRVVATAGGLRSKAKSRTVRVR
jgi:hypothetical protein